MLPKARSICTSAIGSPFEMQEMLNLAAEQNIKPIIELTTLDKVKDAVERVARNEARYRIVMVIDEEAVKKEATVHKNQ